MYSMRTFKLSYEQLNLIYLKEKIVAHDLNKKICVRYVVYLASLNMSVWGAVPEWLKCLPRNLEIVGSNPTWVTTMIPHMTIVLVGSRKRTRH